MRTIPLSTPRRLAALLATVLAASAAPGSGEEPAAPVFSDRLEVTEVVLQVTVVDRQGRPRPGLGPDDFAVQMGGQPVQVTAAWPLRAPAVGSAAGDGGSAVVLLFDNGSLQRRTRRRALDALGPFVAERIAAGDRVMVTSADPGLQVLQAPTRDAAAVAAAFERMERITADGDPVANQRRMLLRSIREASGVTPFGDVAGGNTAAGRRGSSGGGMRSSPAMVTLGQGTGQSQALMLLEQVEILRRQEAAKEVDSLAALHELLQGLGGIEGRVDVLWVGENLVQRPGLEAYRWYHEKFAKAARDLNLDEPALWSSAIDLAPQLELLAAAAQAAGAGLHLVDATERERDAGAPETGRPQLDSTQGSDPRSTSSGRDLSRLGAAVDGPMQLAEVTGGSYLRDPKELDAYLQRVGRLIDGAYLVTVTRDGAASGELDEIAVGVGAPDLTVLHPRRVASLTPSQQLASIALGRLVLDTGPDPLGLRVLAGDAAAAADGTLQTVVLELPVDRLGLVLDGGARHGTLEVGVAVPAAGSTAIRFVELPISVPAGAAARRLRTSLRLVMEPGTAAVGVAVRAAGSGAVGSARLRLVP